MEIIKIKSSFDGRSLKYEASVPELKKIILDKNAFILKGAFSPELLASIQKKVFAWGEKTAPSNPLFDVGIADFHRLDHNPPKALFQRIMHCYSIHFWNEDFLGVQPILRATMDLKYQISGLPRDFATKNVERGQICVGRVTHYPLGGGYYSYHADPNDVEICTDITVMSTRGRDFPQGGLTIEPKKGQKIDVEAHVEAGDVVFFDPSIPHYVAPISAGSEVEWGNSQGRWMMFSAISEWSSNRAPPQKS